MDLSDALGDGWAASGNNQSGGGGAWPAQNPNPTWPGGPAQTNPTWPGGPAQPNPTWPGGPAQPNPTWPSQSGGGGGGTWPSQPSQPSWPSPQPSAPGGKPSPSPGSGPQKSLAVPYSQELPNGVYDKLLITIAGTVKQNADKFAVDLFSSNDLAFHLNPRFDDCGHKVIVRNSCIGKNWGREERNLQHFPFVQGQQFEMKILCNNREFKVAVGNSHMLEFKHRLTNLRSINRFNIHGDLVLSKVHLETLP